MSGPRGNGLDLLEAQDKRVLELLTRIDHNRDQGVEDRARYGDLVKALLRSLAVRESAAVNVRDGLEQAEVLQPVVEGFGEGMEDRRGSMDRLEKLSRGVPGVELRRGQDFDEELVRLRDTMTGQLDWELHEAIPAIRRSLDADTRDRLFRTARYLRRHAPTSVDPERPRWHERAPVISRVTTVVTHLRDFPTAARRVR